MIDATTSLCFRFFRCLHDPTLRDEKRKTPQTCKRDASCRFYQLNEVCHQVASSLLASSSCIKFVKIVLKQLASSRLTTCSRLVIIKPEQAMRAHPDISLTTARCDATVWMELVGFACVFLTYTSAMLMAIHRQ